jgi:hypothetical protein
VSTTLGLHEILILRLLGFCIVVAAVIIYIYSGGSGLFEYGSGGDMKQLLTSSSSSGKGKRLSKLEKLRMGTFCFFFCMIHAVFVHSFDAVV